MLTHCCVPNIGVFTFMLKEKYKGQDVNRLRAAEEGFSRMINSDLPECEALLEQNMQNVLSKGKTV